MCIFSTNTGMNFPVFFIAKMLILWYNMHVD
nr:MAG TPA: hypothetical protein [Caudoviricetes sp.]